MAIKRRSYRDRIVSVGVDCGVIWRYRSGVKKLSSEEVEMFLERQSTRGREDERKYD